MDGEGKPVLVTDVKGKREKVCWGDSTSACLSASVNLTGVPKDKWVPLKKADLKSLLGAEINVKFFLMFSEKTFYNGFLFDDK